MTIPFVRTKLLPPKLNVSVVVRQKVLNLMRAQMSKTLVLLSAPAGYGKTSLLYQMQSDIKNSSVAWCTLEEEDNSKERFLFYIVEALKIVGCEVGSYRHEVSESLDREGIIEFVATLVNELALLNKDVYLFLDNFHFINDDDVFFLVKKLIDYSPGNFHIVIASRVTPDFPLLDMGAHDKAVMFGVNDLKFSYDEANEFLRIRSRLPLSLGEVGLLHSISDGWVTGLQLATISLNKGVMAQYYVDNLQSSENNFDVYFYENIFEKLSEEVKEFLLCTSVLYRFNAGLAAFITSNPDAYKLLSALERDNVFLVPINSESGWYKYHQLFADFLKKRLVESELLDTVDIYSKAIQWCKNNNNNLEAVYYALDSERIDIAVSLVSGCALKLIKDGELSSCLSLLARLPDSEVESRPILVVSKCWALALSNRTKLARDVIRILIGRDDLDSFIIEHIKVITALCDLFDEDMVTLDKNIRAWRDGSNLTNPFLASVGFNISSINASRQGEYERAREFLFEAKKWSDAERGAYACHYAACFNSYSYSRQGFMYISSQIYRDLLGRVSREHGVRSAPACTVASFYSEVLYETDQIQELMDLLNNRIDIIDQVAMPEAISCTYISLSRALRLHGDIDGAKTKLERLQIISEDRCHLNVLGSCILERVKLHLSYDELSTARTLHNKLIQIQGSIEAKRKGNSVQLALTLSLIDLELFIYEGSWDKSYELVCHILEELRGTNEFYKVIELELKKARILSGMGLSVDALELFGEMLRQGEQLGLVRVFADQWPYCEIYLESGEVNRYTSASLSYLQVVLSSFVSHGSSGVKRNSPPASGDMQDVLSKREIDILRLLGQGLQNKQIADSLSLSLDTIKWHLKNIYSKLDVSQRGSAVIKARSLGMIDAD